MEHDKEKIVTKCQKCGYEFLVPSQGSCPKCGCNLNHLDIELSIGGTGTLSTSAIKQKEQTKKYKISHHLVEIISIVISLISIIFCSFINPLLGIIIGILVLILTYYIGKKYAEQWIMEKIIERDHYH